MSPEFVEAEKGDVLRWVQPIAGNRYHELRSKKGVHAKMKWKEMYGSLAYVLTKDDTFTLKRRGFLDPHVTIRRKKGTADLAAFHVDLGITGMIEFRDGPAFEVRRPSVLRRRWVIVDWNNEPLIIVSRKSGGKFLADVSIEANPRSTDSLLLLSAIVWYAFILSSEEWISDSSGESDSV